MSYLTCFLYTITALSTEPRCDTADQTHKPQHCSLHQFPAAWWQIPLPYVRDSYATPGKVSGSFLTNIDKMAMGD
jgi:hypothetical protein